MMVIWYRRYLVFLIVVLFVGCSTIPKERYISISEGLPSGQQWKCNPAFGDINGDGRLDIAAISRKGKGARVWINRDNGFWSDASEGLRMQSSCGGGVDFGDINNDGILDLAVGDHCEGLFVYKGNGKGEWTDASKGLAEFQADDVILGDFNRDGNLDLCACSATNKGIGMFFGDGKGNWNEASKSGLPTSDSCHELAMLDFNNDGILDLAATMMQKPRVWISTGKEQWKESSDGLPDLPRGGQYWGVTAGDVNRDGHPDLALARTIKGPEIYLGDGSGTWQPSFDGLSEVQSAWGIALGDLDGDGYIDLLASGKKNLKDRGNAYGVFFFQGDGNGNWKFISDTGLPQEGLYQSWGLMIADLNDDGALEIGGCFGIAHSEMPPRYLVKLRNQDDLYKGREFGPGGSIRVWKLENVK
jgi:hypothetical protein